MIRNWNSALLILCVFSFLLAARAPSTIQKKITLSKGCSKQITDYLDLPLSSYHILLGNFLNTEQKNTLEVSEGIISIGMNWQDRSSAIPRIEGPRYSITSNIKNDLNAFTGMWQTISKKLQKTNSIQNAKTNKRSIEKLCTQEEEFWIQIHVIDAYRNQYGSEPEKYVLEIMTGEIIPAIKIDPNLDN